MLAVAAALLLVLGASASSAAFAQQSATLHVSFTPYQLGHSTNVAFQIDIAAPADQLPPPLTHLELRYPRQLGLAVSGLGLEACTLATLETLGPEYCPPDSRMGEGTGEAELPVGPEIIRETANVAIVRAPEQEGHISLLFYAQAGGPVSAQIAFPGTLQSAPPPHDESIDITVPLVPGPPGAPYVAIVSLHANIGPQNLTYYEHTHGKPTPYHPQGVLLPNRCPHGGFTFTTILTFFDGTRADTHTNIPCPRERG
jgi:hypothetical protein